MFPKFGKQIYKGTPASIVNLEVMADTGEDDDEEAKVSPIARMGYVMYLPNIDASNWVVNSS